MLVPSQAKRGQGVVTGLAVHLQPFLFLIFADRRFGHVAEVTCGRQRLALSVADARVVQRLLQRTDRIAAFAVPQHTIGHRIRGGGIVGDSRAVGLDASAGDVVDIAFENRGRRLDVRMDRTGTAGIAHPAQRLTVFDAAAIRRLAAPCHVQRLRQHFAVVAHDLHGVPLIVQCADGAGCRRRNRRRIDDEIFLDVRLIAVAGAYFFELAVDGLVFAPWLAAAAGVVFFQILIAVDLFDTVTHALGDDVIRHDDFSLVFC